MKIAIIGFGVEGQAAYEYYRQNGHEITVCDQKTDLQLPADVTGKLGTDYLSGLDGFDVVVRSPFVRPDAIVGANSADIIPKVTSNTNEFLRVCPTRNIIGVTGTKGKGTTSTLIAKMLQAAGKTVHLGGNIGIAPLALLKNDIQPSDWVVLEMSNFQLIDARISPPYAVCLMLAAEHLDWHTDVEEYIAAKQQLFRWQAPDDIAVYNPDNAMTKKVVMVTPARRIPYFAAPGAVVQDGAIMIDGQAICRTDELKLLGEHNWQNACAAVTLVWQITQDVEALRSVLTSFSGLEHRLEFVRSFEGISYYDDSFGTTPETAIVAIEAFKQPKILILGGSDKGASYDELAQAVAANDVRMVLLIGDQAARIQTALDTAGFTNYQAGGQTMDEIVTNARVAAHDGDIVLLSTGCASFDMFQNYKDRGNQFKTAVQALA